MRKETRMNRWLGIALAGASCAFTAGCAGGAMEAREAWPTLLAARGAKPPDGEKKDAAPAPPVPILRPKPIPVAVNWLSADSAIPAVIEAGWTPARYQEVTLRLQRAKGLKLAEIKSIEERQRRQLAYWQGVAERGEVDEKTWRQHKEQAQQVLAMEAEHLKTIEQKMLVEPTEALGDLLKKKKEIKRKFDEAVENFEQAAKSTAGMRQVAESVAENLGLILADLEAEKTLWTSYYARRLTEVDFHSINSQAMLYQRRLP